jgi:urease alpha subunit
VPPPDPAIAEDVAFAESRIRKETSPPSTSCTTWALSCLDSQAMGRVGEVIIRPAGGPQMKVQRDLGKARRTFQVKRYIAKYTIDPAITRRLARSRIHRGRQARRPGDLEAGIFGVKPFWS